jgi:alkaline phosphatase
VRTSHLAIIAACAASATSAQEAAPAVTQSGNAWYVAGQGTIEEMLALQPNTNTARNVILLTSDGNGVGTNYATRLYVGQQAGGMGDDHVLPHETFANVALVKTYSTNGQTPDSAPTAAAMNTGVKTKNDIINITDNVAVDDCAAGLEPANQPTLLSEIAAGMGKSVGVISTARITHATPAAVYSRTVNRDWEDNTLIPEGCEQLDIAAQLFAAMEAGTIDLALGGGRTHFLPEDVTDAEGEAGARTDGRNIPDEVTALGGQIAVDQASFDALDPAGGPVLGLFESSHMQYEHDREGEPSLAEMTEFAITALDANEQGYYLSIEGGRIDHANHAGNLHRAVTDGAAFAEAVQMAMDMTDPAETLIIVTADHEHAIAFNGYCGRGTPITGLCMDIDPAGEMHTGEPVVADDGLTYTVAGYLNGAGSVLIPEGEVDDDDTTPPPAFSGSRPATTQEEALDPDYLQQALIPLGSETHSGEDVAAYARGPFAHLVGGTIEQNVLFHVMHHAMTAGGDAAGTEPTPAAAEGTEMGTEAGSEGTSDDTVEEEANDAVEGLPADATAETLEDAAAEDDASENAGGAEGTTEGTTAP